MLFKTARHVDAGDAGLYAAAIGACQAGVRECSGPSIRSHGRCRGMTGRAGLGFGTVWLPDCQIGAQWQLALHFLGEMRLAGLAESFREKYVKKGAWSFYISMFPGSNQSA